MTTSSSGYLGLLDDNMDIVGHGWAGQVPIYEGAWYEGDLYQSSIKVDGTKK
jgi:hypothetical protein